MPRREDSGCPLMTASVAGGRLPDSKLQWTGWGWSKSTPQSSELYIYKGFSLPDFRALAFGKDKLGCPALWPSPVLVPWFQWFLAWQTGHTLLPPQPQGVSHPDLEPLPPRGCSLSPHSNRSPQSHHHLILTKTTGPEREVPQCLECTHPSETSAKH